MYLYYIELFGDLCTALVHVACIFTALIRYIMYSPKLITITFLHISYVFCTHVCSFAVDRFLIRPCIQSIVHVHKCMLYYNVHVQLCTYVHAVQLKFLYTNLQWNPSIYRDTL